MTPLLSTSCALVRFLLVLAAPAQLEVFPPSVTLDHPRDVQSLVVRSVDAGGLSRDRTLDAVVTCDNPALVRIAGNTVAPLADGQSVLRVALGGASLAVPLTVRNAAAPRPVSFRLDVMPILARSGCNSGSCHGSARGQDGFHLSLFGYDPDGDYYALTRELPGRRINPALPADSLIIRKALHAVPHSGGQRLAPGDGRYEVLIDWLRGGAPRDAADVPAVAALEIFPPDAVLESPGAAQRLVLRARYNDGSDRDVTSLAVFLSSNESSARVDPAGVVTALQPGEALVLARFGAFTVGLPVIVVPAGAPLPAPDPAANYVDELVAAKLQRLRIEPSPLCTDEEFLRRACLDLVGLLPSPAERERFLAHPGPDRRAALVDALLARKEFVELWVMKWAERLQIRSTPQVSYKAMLLYYNWLGERIAAGTPIRRIVRDLIAAEGGTFTNPATNFYQIEQDPLKLAENTAQAFLGVRIQCAQCHNHPFDRWTMDDYYGFAAFFAQVGRKSAEDPRETVLFNRAAGDVRHPVGARVMAPKFLGGPLPDLAGRDRRAALADWLTAPDNRLFARNVANFIWAHFFGRGIVEPADDLRVSNPPANAALLDALADRLVATDFDLRRLVRDICTSRAYQRSSRTNPSNAADERNFSHAAVRRIRAECLLDCISQVTQTRDKFPGLPLGARAVQIADGSVTNYFLTAFGRARRDTVCTCEVVMEPSLTQALHLLNGDTVQRKIAEGRVVRSLLESGAAPDEVLRRLYLACLCREPTGDERSRLAALLAEAPDPAAGLEDAFWSILNSKEFMFNH